MVNAQKWLERNFPEHIRKSIRKLNLTCPNLEGDLDLIDFTSLEEINIIDNLLGRIKNIHGNVSIIYSNWKDIHLDFTEKLRKNWENQGFSYKETKKWIKLGLTPYETRVADYLREQGYDAKLYSDNFDIEELREKYANSLVENYSSEEENSENYEKKAIFEDWKKIHLDFKENYWAKTSWEQLGFNYKQVRWWIKANGLEPKNWDLAYYLREEIKRKGFNERLVEEYDSWLVFSFHWVL